MDGLLKQGENLVLPSGEDKVVEKGFDFRAWLFVFLFSLMPLGFGFFWGSETGPSLKLFLGTVVVIAVLSVFFLAFNWLFVWNSPSRLSLVSGRWYWYIGIGLILAQVNMACAGVWDEAWHTIFRLPFGPDFLWRPHMLLYLGFGVQLIVGFGVMFFVTFIARGNFRQRLQANPLFGLFLMLTAFVVWMLPADPVWHEIYKEDLSVWSIPHVILFYGGTIFTFLCYSSLEFALQAFARSADVARNRFFVVGRFAFRFLILFVFSYQSFFQLLDFSPGAGSGPKPVWLLPIVAVLLAYGLTQISRYVMGTVYWAGAAALLAFGLRYSLYGYFSGFESADLDTLLWRGMAILLPLASFLVGNAVNTFMGRDGLASRIRAAVIACIVNLPFYAFVFALGLFSVQGLGLLLIVPLLLGLDFVLKVIFAFFRSILQFSPVSQPLTLVDTVLPLLFLAGNMAFLLYFVLTAVPPIVN